MKTMKFKYDNHVITFNAANGDVICETCSISWTQAKAVRFMWENNIYDMTFNGCRIVRA